MWFYGGGGVRTLTWYYVPAFLGCYFVKFGIAIGGFSSRWRNPNYINWVNFEQIMLKSTQVEQNWVLFFRKWYTGEWVVVQKIGTEKVQFSKSGSNIHVQFWRKYLFRDYSTHVQHFAALILTYRERLQWKHSKQNVLVDFCTCMLVMLYAFRIKCCLRFVSFCFSTPFS